MHVVLLSGTVRFLFVTFIWIPTYLRLDSLAAPTHWYYGGIRQIQHDYGPQGKNENRQLEPSTWSKPLDS